MSYLVGLGFTQKEGWRALKCLLAPETLIRSTITVDNGVLWLKSSKPARPGRFVNPATLVDFDKNSSTKEMHEGDREWADICADYAEVMS